MIPALQGMFKVQTLTVAQLMTVYGLAHFESAGYSAAEMDQNAKEIEDLTGYWIKEGIKWN